MRPFTAVDLPPEMFPFTVRMFRGDEQVYEVDVSGPGALQIPALGGITRVLATFANGEAVDHYPTAEP